MTNKKILIIQRRPGIGDMCVFLPFIHKICEVKKNYEFTLLTSKRSKSEELLEYDPFIKKIVFYENFSGFLGFFKFIFFLKKNFFNEVFIFHSSKKIYLACIFAGIKKIYFYGFFKNKDSIINQAKNFISNTLQLDKNNLFLKTKIFISPEIIKREDFIIIGIGGSGPTKKWSINNYIELIKKIIKIKKFNFIIAGGIEEKEDYEKIFNSFLNSEIKLISLCNLNVKSSIDIMRKGKVYIGNDTGFMHLSGLLGILSFGLFGDTPTDYVDYNKNITPIIPKNYKSITHNSRAINQISVDHVLETVFLKIKNI